MRHVIAVSTNKGGVLKTSISTNLAGLLSKKGKVLIIDTDNQGNAALSFGRNPDDYQYTIYDVLVDGLDASAAVDHVYENIDIIPSNDEMEFFTYDILNNKEKYPQPFHLLKNAMKVLEQDYDYIIVDTPPNLGLEQGNVLSYVDEVIIPFQPEVYSMRSLQKIGRAIELFKRDHNAFLSVSGVVATLVDSRTVLHSTVLSECRKYCMDSGIRMFDTVIPRTIRYANAIAYEGLPATLTEKNNNLIQAYIDLEGEIFNGSK